MTETERLTQLLKEADKNTSDKLIMDYEESVADNAAYLLAHGVMYPPCKVGDTVYIIDNSDMLEIDPSVCSVVDDEIYEMGYGRTQSGELKWLFLVLESGADFYDTDVGKTVFLTQEDAEQALRERSLK